MEIILILLVGWWLSGVLGFRELKKPRRKRKRSFWEPDLDEYDWEEFNKRNGHEAIYIYDLIFRNHSDNSGVIDTIQHFT